MENSNVSEANKKQWEAVRSYQKLSELGMMRGLRQKVKVLGKWLSHVRVGADM
jgi:hypothetical protein